MKPCDVSEEEKEIRNLDRSVLEKMVMDQKKIIRAILWIDPTFDFSTFTPSSFAQEVRQGIIDRITHNG